MSRLQALNRSFYNDLIPRYMDKKEYYPIISLDFSINSFNCARLLKKLCDPARPFVVQNWDDKPDYGEVE